jgi:hypothetical protein
VNLDNLTQRLELLTKEYPKDRLGFTIGTLTSYDFEDDFYLTPIRTSSRIVYSGAIVRNVETALNMTKIIDSKVAYIFVDSEKKVSESNYGLNDVGNIEKAVATNISSATLLTYKGNDLTVQSADKLLRVLAPNLTGAKVAVAGVGNIGMKLALALLERGNSVFLYSQDTVHSDEVAKLLNKLKLKTTIARAFSAKNLTEAVEGAQVLIATSNKKRFIGPEHVKLMQPLRNFSLPLLIDVGKGCFRDDVSEGHQIVVRVDVGDELSKEIDSLINLHEFQNSTVKVKVIGGTRFVVRGVVGRKGDVLVDNLSAPTSILGVCDGDGNVESSSYEHLEELLRKVQSIS